MLDRLWNARGWNAAAERLFTGWLDRGEASAQPAALHLSRARRARSDLRLADSRRAGSPPSFAPPRSARLDDPALKALIAELRQSSADFAAFWDSHGVLDREGGVRAFRHPSDGVLSYEQVTFEPAGHADLKLTMLLPRA